jgi:predicted lipoprotein with Yx(FWY)xxD motif
MRKSLISRFALPSVAVASVLILSACANSSSTVPAAGGGTSTNSGGGAGSALTVSAKSLPGVGKVLVTPDGLPLYYLKTETNGSIKCMDTCAAEWPPLLLPSSTDKASAGPGVMGKLSTVSRPDGTTQVTYNGMPLYTFASDTAGHATGQGVQNFYVVSASGTGGSGPSPTATKSSSGHYGY